MVWVKFFGQVLGAILVAALIIGIIWWLSSQVSATNKAESKLRKSADRGDAMLRILKQQSQEHPNYQNLTPTTTPSVTHIAVATATPTPSLPQFITLTQPVSIPVQYGTVGLQPGTKLQLVTKDGAMVRVRYEKADYWISLDQTDLR